MQANKITIQEILTHDRQYIIPLFQRSYSWTKTEWQTFWDDIKDLLNIEDNSDPKTHFLGVVMTTDLETSLGKVPKSLVIDGQQRLTTILILLSIMRNRAKEIECEELAAELEHKFLTNQFKKGEEKYKLIPTQVDRDDFMKLIDFNEIEVSSSIGQCFNFFSRKIKANQQFLEKLKLTIFARLSLIAVTLDKDDDPYLIFESLNAKGRELTQADLIRNYLFMKIDKDQQEVIYNQKWKPMEESLNIHLTEFLRHYLSRKGAQVRKSDIYISFKSLVTNDNALTYLNDLHKFSQYYYRFLEPTHEDRIEIKKHLNRIKSSDVSVIYPFILSCYDDYRANVLSLEEFLEVFDILENFVIRRFICKIPTQGLNRIFITLYSQAIKGTSLKKSRFVDNIKSILQTQNYPTDEQVKDELAVLQLYSKRSSGKSKAKLILSILEESFEHKEIVSLQGLTIEHIMPQTLSEEWKKLLGNEWDKIHSLYLHTLGNLTLTAYNSELRNDPFHKKKKEFMNSHLELNKYFSNLQSWRGEDIETRTKVLSVKLLDVYPYFGDKNNLSKDSYNGVTGRKPKSVIIFEETYAVKTWRDVLEITLNEIYLKEKRKFEEIEEELSHFISSDQTKFRSSKKLKNGKYIDLNLSAKNIYNLCSRATAIAECSEEWHIEFLDREN